MTQEVKLFERSLGEYLVKHDELIADGYKIVNGSQLKSNLGLRATYIKQEVVEKPAAKTRARKSTKKVTETEE